MAAKPRGSEQLKQQCPGLATLTPEELAQLTGGYSYVYYFPKGVPADWYVVQNPLEHGVNPATTNVRNVLSR